MIVDASPDGLWNIAQTLLIFLFLAVGAFFLFKYFRGKETELKSANQINIGYGFFFIATGLNQLVYAITSVSDFWSAAGSFFGQTTIHLYLTSTYSVPIPHQIMLMIILIFLAIVPLMYPLDKYVKNRPKTPVFKISLITLIIQIVGYCWLYIINRILAPGGITGSQLIYDGDVSTGIGQVENVFFLIFVVFQILILLLLMWNFVVFYFILAIKSPTGVLRTKSILIFVGIMLLYLALFVGNVYVPTMRIYHLGYLILLPPITFVIALLLIFAGFNKREKKED